MFISKPKKKKKDKKIAIFRSNPKRYFAWYIYNV